MTSLTAVLSIDCVLVGLGAPAGTCLGSFEDAGGGGSVDLLAAATAGSTFDGWSGDCRGTAVRCVLTFASGPDVDFNVTASFVRLGDLDVTTHTTGFDLDADGYIVTVGSNTEAIGANETKRISGIPAGAQTVSISGVASNCAVSGLNPRNVGISSQSVTSITFDVTCVPIAGPPVAWYMFNGNAADSSGNGYDGTVMGATLTADAGGSAGRAYSFDGVDDYIDLGDAFNQVQVPFTLTAWVFRAAGGTNMAILSSDNANPPTLGQYNGFWALVLVSGGFSMTLGDGGSPSTVSRRSGATGAPIPLNTWTHVAFVVNTPTDMNLYLDGTDVGVAYEGTGGTMTRLAGFPATIGRLTFFGAPSNYFNGALDDIRVYDRALSAAEVQAVAAGGAR